MAKHPIDELIKRKLEGLEAEPAPGVWAGIQAGLPAADAGVRPWGWRIAGAAAAILLLGGAVWWFSAGDPGSTGVNTYAGRGTTPGTSPVVTPAPQEKQNPVQPAVNPAEAGDPSTGQPAQTRKWFRRDDKAPVQQPAPEPVQKELPPAPQEWLQPQNLNPIAQEEPSRVLEPLENLNLPSDAPVAFADAGAEHEKRVLDLSSTQGRKSVSRDVAAYLAKGANNLGIPTQYEYQEMENNQAKSTFSADFGFFKIKRVKNIND